MTVSEVVNTISSLAHFTQFVNKYLYYMKELNLALKELRNGAEVILLERKDPAYFPALVRGMVDSAVLERCGEFT